MVINDTKRKMWSKVIPLMERFLDFAAKFSMQFQPESHTITSQREGDGVHIPVLLQPSIDGPLFPGILPGLVSKGSMFFVQKTEGLPQECY